MATRDTRLSPNTGRAVKLEASLACANFRNLEADIAQLKEGGIDYLHIDLMDGKFVPNLALDFGIMQMVRDSFDLPMECHLMLLEPERYIEQTVRSGVKYVTIHVEATYHVQRVLQQIRDASARPGIVLNPATPIQCLNYILDDIEMVTVMTVNPGFAGQRLIPAMLRKISDVRSMLDANGLNEIEIQVDGNVSFQNIPSMVSAGATMLVGGTSSVFRQDLTIGEAISKVREIVRGVEVRQ